MHLGWHLGERSRCCGQKTTDLVCSQCEDICLEGVLCIDKFPLPAAKGRLDPWPSVPEASRDRLGSTSSMTTCKNAGRRLASGRGRWMPWDALPCWKRRKVTRPLSGLPAVELLVGLHAESCNQSLVTKDKSAGDCRSEPSTAPAQKSSRATPWQFRHGNPTILRRGPGGQEVCVLRTSTTPHTLSALSGSQHLQTGHLCHHGGCRLLLEAPQGLRTSGRWSYWWVCMQNHANSPWLQRTSLLETAAASHQQLLHRNLRKAPGRRITGTVSRCQASHRHMQRTSRCYGQRS